MHRQITAFLAATLFSVPTFAIDSNIQMTGNAFSDACTRANESWVSFCNGYVQAAIDSLRDGDGVCIPAGTTRTQIVTLTERTITASEQLKSMNALEAVRLTIRYAFPCQ
jgi:molecular chaperone DnaK (HSP70)